MITKEEILKLVTASKRPFESDLLERIVEAQEDASLQSPGVEAHYYRFLYWLAKMMKPKLSLELGTHTGISSACIAEGYSQGKVITVNCLYELREECKRFNIEYRKHDSLEKVNLPWQLDILFIDTWHDGVRCLAEYNLYKNEMAENSVILFDDIHLLDCMRKFWESFIPEKGEKFEIPVHGEAGFGVVLLRP